MSEQDIAVVISVRCYDCTPEEAVKEFRAFLSECGGIPAGPDGEIEMLDVNLLFPKAEPKCTCNHGKGDHGYVSGPQQGCFKCGCWGYESA